MTKKKTKKVTKKKAKKKTKILVIYNCNNGYACGCCSSSWEETQVYEIDENIEEWLKEESEIIEKSHNRALHPEDRFEIKAAYIVSKALIENDVLIINA